LSSGSEAFARQMTLDKNRSRLLCALTFAAAPKLASDTFCVDPHGKLRKWRLARVLNLAASRFIRRTAGHRPRLGLAENGERFKIEPDRLLYALRWLQRTSQSRPTSNWGSSATLKIWYNATIILLRAALRAAPA
jgi:hypothetical protein